MNIQTTENRYLGFSGAARYLGTSMATVRRLVEAGQLRVYKVGPKLCRFDKRELDELVHAGATTANEINDAAG
jgi:excisionase family DNA binding protein